MEGGDYSLLGKYLADYHKPGINGEMNAIVRLDKIFIYIRGEEGAFVCLSIMYCFSSISSRTLLCIQNFSDLGLFV